MFRLKIYVCLSCSGHFVSPDSEQPWPALASDFLNIVWPPFPLFCSNGSSHFFSSCFFIIFHLFISLVLDPVWLSYIYLLVSSSHLVVNESIELYLLLTIFFIFGFFYSYSNLPVLFSFAVYSILMLLVPPCIALTLLNKLIFYIRSALLVSEVARFNPAVGNFSCSCWISCSVFIFGSDCEIRLWN